MAALLLFGGTTEGRILAEQFSKKGWDVLVSVATEYGASLLPQRENLKIHVGRMDEKEMERFLRENIFQAVIDATHPYAMLASENIYKACTSNQLPYYRCARPSQPGDGCLYVKDAAQAVDYLKEHPGRIFLTTGSKELPLFCAIDEIRERLVVRVLPSIEVLRQCLQLGLLGSQIICMQGPFTRELNCALFQQYKADYLITKETGRAGGFEEKIEAAHQCQIKTIVIGRPSEPENSYTWEEILAVLSAEKGGKTP